MDTINSGVEFIRIDMKVNEKTLLDLSERVIRIEESNKQAYLRIDNLKEKMKKE
ncbi:MAG: hypothetical protein ACI35O_01180 [Bacillaceae bacterium]